MKDPSAVIRTLQVTEKGSRLTSAENKYFFLVDPGANKLEIRRAVESLFKVRVARVNTMNYQGKRKRHPRMQRAGATSAWKRAIVTLKEGKIEIS